MSKKLIFFLIAFTGFAMVSNAQTATENKTSGTETKHVCPLTSTSQAGSLAVPAAADAQEGAKHTCAPECKHGAATAEQPLKPHQCSQACINGCTFAHGEQGHTCSEVCAKKM
ncbi:MAG: hypothetical protein AB7G44_06670 [Bacteroidia bacterium]